VEFVVELRVGKIDQHVGSPQTDRPRRFATPNRAAAERKLIPASIAAKSRVRKSIERG
jgi:hypothetical protein